MAIVRNITLMVFSISLEGRLLSENEHSQSNSKTQLSSHQGLMGWLEWDKILKQISFAFTSNNDVIQPKAQAGEQLHLSTTLKIA